MPVDRTTFKTDMAIRAAKEWEDAKDQQNNALAVDQNQRGRSQSKMMGSPT